MANQRICSVDGCGNRYAAKGFCHTHYYRMRKYGDALTTEKLPNGEAARFYREHIIPYEGDECILWPYARTNGYGRVLLDGKDGIVSRFLCEDVYGPPPTLEHEAAHSCGNRSCANKRHLRWATPTENSADKLIHGTHNRGERNHCTKLTASQASEILSLAGEETQEKLAARFGVSRSTISNIQCRATWRWLDAEP